MPEQLSKYPEVTIKVLQGAGGRCGPGIEKKILTQCPAERFCSFQSGEICAYGIDQIQQMSQISVQELAKVVCSPCSTAEFAWPEAGALSATFLLGLAIGACYRRLRRR